jgi:hypothetical protein
LYVYLAVAQGSTRSAPARRITNKLDDATLDVLMTRLEARGKHPRFVDMMREYLDAMAIDMAKSILDLG